MRAMNASPSALRDKQQLADRAAALDCLVRLRGVGERVLGVDVDLELPLAHPAKDLVSDADVLLAPAVVGAGVDAEIVGARTAGAALRPVHLRRAAAALAVGDAVALRLEAHDAAQDVI